MDRNEQWLQWAIELQSLAQAGLTYGKDIYDRERYERIRVISAEILSHMSGIPTETEKTCSATKLDIRPRSWTPVQPFLEMGKFFLFVRTTENGHFLAAGVM